MSPSQLGICRMGSSCDISRMIGSCVICQCLVSLPHLLLFYSKVDLQVLEYAGYGKNFIISNKISPDAFVQVAFQVAYHRIYRESVNTYETLMTKRFFHGRTEAGFSVTNESIVLARSFDDVAISPESLAEMIRRAADAHVALVKLGSDGRGIRHMYAMRCLAEQEAGGAVPEVYEGQGWKTLSRIMMSTSNCGNPALRMFGFGPVEQEGFGIGYIIKDDNMGFCATSKHRQTARLMEALQNTLNDMHDALTGHWSARVTPGTLRLNLANWTSDGKSPKLPGDRPPNMPSPLHAMKR